MILLVLIQMFLEDFSFYMNWPLMVVNKMRLSAFVFDVFFTVEFITRLVNSIRKQKAVDYFFYRNGWIDLLASLPLLLLISGPEFLLQIFEINLSTAGFINAVGMLKVVKAIRVARILRLLRVLKVFGKIKNVSSTAAQRHVTVISTITAFSIIVFLIVISILQSVGVISSRYDDMIAEEQKINSVFKKMYAHADMNDLENMLKFSALKFDNILLIDLKGKTVYKSPEMDKERYQYYNKIEDAEIINTYYELSDKLQITYFRYDYKRKEALGNLINFILIIFVLGCIILVYTRFFALTVSDPVYVMRMGFEKRDYTYAVKIQKHFEDDDIFLLARDYNARWLPAKIRKLSEMSASTSKLSFEDVFKQS